MLSQTIGTRQRRFNNAINHTVRRIEHWTKYGSVRTCDFAGRQNVVCLQTKKRAARIRYKLKMVNKAPHTFAVDVHSPIENETWGAGIVNGCWHPNNGMWKTILVQVQDGDDVLITSVGKDGAIAAGDKCYIDLMSVKITV